MKLVLHILVVICLRDTNGLRCELTFSGSSVNIKPHLPTLFWAREHQYTPLRQVIRGEGLGVHENSTDLCAPHFRINSQTSTRDQYLNFLIVTYLQASKKGDEIDSENNQQRYISLSLQTS